MILIPYEKVTYHTKFSPDEVIQKVQSIMDTEHRWWFSRINHSRPYKGKVSAHMFAIRRLINYGNPFLPRIHGAITQQDDDTQVQITLKPHPFAIFCMVAIIAALAFLWWSNYQEIIIDFSQPKVYLPPILIPSIYILMMIGFKVEAHVSELYLRDLLEAWVSKNIG